MGIDEYTFLCKKFQSIKNRYVYTHTLDDSTGATASVNFFMFTIYIYNTHYSLQWGATQMSYNQPWKMKAL